MSLGVMISLGSTAIVGQVAERLHDHVLARRQVGDFVRIGDVEGTVAELGALRDARSGRLNDEEVTIPNAVVVAAITKNYSAAPESPDGSSSTTLTIGYDTPWRQVEALLLLAAADRTPGLRKSPRPVVLQRALTDFYVEYELCVYLERPELRVVTLTALHANIQDCFNEYGVQIMSPHYEADPGGEEGGAAGRVVRAAREEAGVSRA